MKSQNDAMEEIFLLVRRVQGNGDLVAAWTLLDRMRAHGSALKLYWDEQDQSWCCSWVVGGRRWTAHSGHPYYAVSGAVQQVFDGLGVLPGGS